MIKSASRSSLVEDVKYTSMSAGVVPSNEYLIQSTLLESTTPSVTFDNLAQFAGVYKHFQIVFAARSDRNQNADSSFIRFNGDSGSNYSWHSLRVADTSAVGSEGFASQTLMRSGRTSSDTTTSSVFASSVIDILDPYSTTKNTTIKFFNGFMAATSNWVELGSGAWYNTNALTSITLDQVFGSNFVAGSRFSLYGVTA